MGSKWAIDKKNAFEHASCVAVATAKELLRRDEVWARDHPHLGSGSSPPPICRDHLAALLIPLLNGAKAQNSGTAAGADAAAADTAAGAGAGAAAAAAAVGAIAAASAAAGAAAAAAAADAASPEPATDAADVAMRDCAALARRLMSLPATVSDEQAVRAAFGKMQLPCVVASSGSLVDTSRLLINYVGRHPSSMAVLAEKLDRETGTDTFTPQVGSVQTALAMQPDVAAFIALCRLLRSTPRSTLSLDSSSSTAWGSELAYDDSVVSMLPAFVLCCM